MKYIKLDKEDLFFEYQGKRIAEVLDNGKVKYSEKVPRGYKKEIENFIIGIQNGTVDIV